MIDVVYGFAVVTENDFHDFHSQLSWFPITKWDAASGFTQTDVEKELGFYQANIDKLDEYIAKAYWGNFLNNNHMEKLGGIGKVRKEAPVALVEPLPNGGAYVQLTGLPYNFAEESYPKSLSALDTYFQTLILPGRGNIAF